MRLRSDSFKDPWRYINFICIFFKFCIVPYCAIMQNFTPIGVTVAKISVTEQLH